MFKKKNILNSLDLKAIMTNYEVLFPCLMIIFIYFSQLLLLEEVSQILYPTLMKLSQTLCPEYGSDDSNGISEKKK